MNANIYTHKAQNWEEAREKCAQIGWPIYVEIADQGPHKLYPTGYTRPKLPNEKVPA
jgi:phage terminase large subunit-like protein